MVAGAWADHGEASCVSKMVFSAKCGNKRSVRYCNSCIFYTNSSSRDWWACVCVAQSRSCLLTKTSRFSSLLASSLHPFIGGMGCMVSARCFSLLLATTQDSVRHFCGMQGGFVGCADGVLYSCLERKGSGSESGTTDGARQPHSACHRTTRSRAKQQRGTTMRYMNYTVA